MSDDNVQFDVNYSDRKWFCSAEQLERARKFVRDAPPDASPAKIAWVKRLIEIAVVIPTMPTELVEVGESRPVDLTTGSPFVAVCQNPPAERAESMGPLEELGAEMRNHVAGEVTKAAIAGDPYGEHVFEIEIEGERHEVSFWGKRSDAEKKAREWAASEGVRLIGPVEK